MSTFPPQGWRAGDPTQASPLVDARGSLRPPVRCRHCSKALRRCGHGWVHADSREDVCYAPPQHYPEPEGGNAHDMVVERDGQPLGERPDLPAVARAHKPVDDRADEVDSLRRANNRLQQVNDDLERKHERISIPYEAEIERLRGELATARENLSERTKERDWLESLVTDIAAERDKANDEVTQLKGELAAAKFSPAGA